MDITDKDLQVTGLYNQYKQSKTIIYCKKPGKNGGDYIPCRFNTIEYKYDKVEFKINENFKLRPDQKVAYDEMLDKCKEDKPCIPIFCHMFTGFGKSKLSIYFSAMKKLPILLIISSDTIRQGWIKSFKDMLGIDPYIASGPILGKHNICILTMQLALRHNFNREDYKHYGTVIVDEADLMCTQNNVNTMLEFSPKYFIGLTATIRRLNDGLDKVLDVFWGHRRLWIRRLKEYDNKCQMNLHILNTGISVPKLTNRKGTIDWTAISEVVSENEDRNIIIRNLCLLHKNSKILILCRWKNHVKILVDMLRDIGEDVSSYYGNNSSYYDSHILISTISKGGRGMDTANVSINHDEREFDVVILTLTSKDCDQQIGRSRSSDTIVYLLVDNLSTMQKHSRLVSDAYKKRKANIHIEYI